MYSAIYRDFRPDRFDQIVGQDHIVRILRNQIASGQTGHAYLFCGTRGTGKTTTARILAKALNCESEGERPCGECDNCRAIKDGTFMDVIEIDAASNNGVDSIRELRESVKYPPVRGRNKVYIIDEVHMLSQGAFNALLKTLEEPPESVVFILATTEPQKLPATILSRCMRLDFRRVSERVIKENMQMICDARGISADPAALSLIAVNADGSVRDSLSILEQCISTGENHISRDDVAELLGTAGEESLIALTDSIIQGRISDGLLLLDRIIRSGSDVKQFMKEWLSHFRNLLMAKYVQQPENMLNMSVENVQRVTLQSAEITTELLNRAITDLTKTISDAKWSSQPRVLLEMCIVRLGAPQETEEAFAFRSDAVSRTLQQQMAELQAQIVSASGSGAGAAKAAEISGASKMSEMSERSGTAEISGSSAGRAEDFHTDYIPEDGANVIFSADDLSDEMADMPTMQQIYEAMESGAPDRAAQASRVSHKTSGTGTSGSAQPFGAADEGSAADRIDSDGAGSAGVEIGSSGNDGKDRKDASSVPAVDVEELWNTVVKKAVGEKPMLIRVETKAHPVRIENGAFYVSADDEYTEKVLMEKGKDIIEEKLEMYYGSRLILKLGHSSEPAAPAAAQSSGISAENIAKQIEERFHMKVDVE